MPSNSESPGDAAHKTSEADELSFTARYTISYRTMMSHSEPYDSLTSRCCSHAHRICNEIDLSNDLALQILLTNNLVRHRQ